MRKESYYFPHEYNATNDPKIQALLTYCGPVGLAIYWYVVELLYQDGENELLADDTTWAIISRVLNFPDGSNMLPHYDLPGPPLPPSNRLDMEIKMAVMTMGKIGLLTISENGRIRSDSVDRRLAERHEISEKGRENAKKRWYPNATPMGAECDPNAIKEKKGKKKKEKNTIADAALRLVKLQKLQDEVLTSQPLQDLYEDFRQERNSGKGKFTVRAEILTLERLQPLTVDQRMRAISSCIENGWKGIRWGIKDIGINNPHKSNRGTGAVDYLRAQDGTA